MDVRARSMDEGIAGAASGERVSSRVLLVGLREEEGARLAEVLEVVGHTVAAMTAGDTLLARVREWRPDLVLLALDLPGMAGYHLLRTLREAEPALPLMLYATRADEADTVLAFRLGADGYLTTDCGVLELLARLEALLRRRAAQAQPKREILRVGPLEIEPGARTVRLARAPVALRPKEFDLLLALARRGGAVASREELLREVWHVSEPVTTRAVDLHVLELRRKLERDPAAPRLILTVRTKGYRLALRPADGGG